MRVSPVFHPTLLWLGLTLLGPFAACAQVSPATAGNPPALPSPAAAPGAAASPVNGAPPHVGASAPQVVPTPPTVTQPTVSNNAAPAGSSTTRGEVLDGGEVTSSSVPSPATPAAWTRLTVAVPNCLVPPKIDGRLDDICWRTAKRASGFYRLAGSSAVSPADQTEVWLCADTTHLYVAFHCLDSQPQHIQASATQRDGNVFRDDYVGIDLDSQNSRHNYSSFFVNARGTQAEQIEGGTADNISWAGDWKAATRRTTNGWTCEMSVPFALLRYSRGATAFGMDFYRYLAREGTYQNWPYLPPAGAGPGEGPYIHEFTNIHPPFFAPRPIFLPYTLFTGGTGSAGKVGVDIKYPLSTTLTGVATIKPDFQTIEQDVTGINFSYTEKLLTDRRPFFAEGSGFLPYQDLFYSRRIGQLDGGLKVAGKQGDTSVGLLATDTRGTGLAQNAAVLALSQDIGLYSRATLNYVNDIQPGQPSNQVAKLEGAYGFRVGPNQWTLLANHTPSWQGGRHRDSKDYFKFSTTATPGHPTLTADYGDIGPNFITNLGFVPDLDNKGSSLNVEQNNSFDKGRLRGYDVALSANTYQHHTGGFFQNDVNGNLYLESHDGFSLDLNVDQSRRDLFRDHANQASFGWGRRTLYQRGSVADTVGRQASQPYNFLTFSQGVLVSRPFSLQLNYSRLRLGETHSTQTILTGNYLLSAERSIGARVVNQAGADQGSGLGTDIYFSFGQHVRAGSDLFLLFGDPNSPRTRGKITLKIIRPF